MRLDGVYDITGMAKVEVRDAVDGVLNVLDLKTIRVCFCELVCIVVACVSLVFYGAFKEQRSQARIELDRDANESRLEGQINDKCGAAVGK